MTEQHPRRGHDALATPAPWDVAGVGEALGVPAEPRVDGLHGEGVRLRIGEPPTTEVELFPASRTVRITGENLQLSLFRQAPPTIAPEGVIFELPIPPGRRWLSVSPRGEVTLFYHPTNTPDISPKALESPPASPPPSNNTQTPIREEQLARADLVTFGSPLASETAAPSEEKQERVRLDGRLGQDPRFKTLRNGRLVAEFPLAVRNEMNPERPTWHNVAVFNERAEALRDQVTKGRPVTVVGYVHRSEYTGKDGKPKTKEEIYATAIIPR